MIEEEQTMLRTCKTLFFALEPTLNICIVFIQLYLIIVFFCLLIDWLIDLLIFPKGNIVRECGKQQIKMYTNN